MNSNQLIAAGRGLAATLLLAVPAAASTFEKIDPWVFSELARSAEAEAEFLIVLDEQADLAVARGLPTKLEKGRYVFETLSTLAAASQAPLLDELAAAGLPHRPFWIVNMVWAKGNAAAVVSLAARSDVARIAANPRLRNALPEPDGEVLQLSPDAVEWNIAKVNADDVWALGYTGVGAVIGGQDTGYDWDHPALQAKYRGWNGAAADHDYNWHDSIHADIDGNGTNPCGFNSGVPCADGSHGTHTMGTMVGDDGAGNQIGMAPGARWVSCRNMEEGWGTAATYSECYEWFVAPTDLAGQNPDPAQAPDVINNSWGCPASGAPGTSECEDQPIDVMQAVVENLRAAGIFSAHSAGNDGSSCSSTNTPAAIYDASFSVANTNSSDGLASSSSRGPVSVDGSGRRKPDIAAPGSNIRSSVTGTGYSSFSGTSMAAPHVAGLVALLIDADERLRGNVDALEELIRESAFTGVSASGTCGGIAATTIPNNHFGWGRIDAVAAVQLLQSGFLFRDGFETGATDDWSRIGFEP